MKNKWIAIGVIALSIGIPKDLYAQSLEIYEAEGAYIAKVVTQGQPLMQSPMEGLWSIATAWKEDWPSDWHHAKATAKTTSGPWQILTGKLILPEGEWHLRDAFKQEDGRIKVVRRFEWHGEQPLDSVTLSVRWQVPSSDVEAFLPGILYYGNPSGEKNGRERVPVFHSRPNEEAIFEEHRYPMPFASVEWPNEGVFAGAALHTLPSPVPFGHHTDQWWSLGVLAREAHTETLLLSGPISYNGQRSVAKAIQGGSLPYEDTYLSVLPGAVIEKSFYLESYTVDQRGSGFQRPLYTSLDLFQPFYVGDFPEIEEIVREKYRFAQSRWIEGEAFAGFNMFPDFVPQRIVMGWAGQSEAPSYALQVLADNLGDEQIWDSVQRATDHLVTAPIGAEGFPVIYEVKENRWHRPDPVSQGQAMNSLALAIRTGREKEQLDTSSWEAFLRQASDVHARRILSDTWSPVNTAEAFFIAPLLLAAELFENDEFASAALKAADYYADRHLGMEEPYWGGTLDATCEDKEGAWGTFQGFLAAYEYTNQAKYLEWAQHAADVVLSYTVVWDIPLPAGRLADHAFKTRGWTGVSPQNQHLDVYGVLIAPSFYKLGALTGNDVLKQIAMVMYRSAGQLIDPFGSQGEQIQQTIFSQRGNMSDVFTMRGGYSEDWTVFWITAHFLHAAAQFKEMGVAF